MRPTSELRLPRQPGDISLPPHRRPGGPVHQVPQTQSVETDLVLR